MTQHTQTEVPHLNTADRSQGGGGGGVSYKTFINTHMDIHKHIYLHNFINIHKHKQTLICT